MIRVAAHLDIANRSPVQHPRVEGGDVIALADAHPAGSGELVPADCYVYNGMTGCVYEMIRMCI